MSAKKNNSETAKAGKFQWFLFVIVIPIVFSVTLLLVILNIAGIKVSDIAQKIPFVSTFVENKDDEQLDKEYTERIEELEAQVNDYKKQVESLQAEAETNDKEIAKKEDEVAQLQIDLKQKQENELSEEEQLKNLTASYKDMDPESAAPIFEAMEKDLAIQILEQLDAKQRGAIFENMDPSIVATLSEAFLATNN